MLHITHKPYIQIFKCSPASPHHTVLGHLYRADQNGRYVLIISGSGPMSAPRSLFHTPWGKHSDKIIRVEIGEGITEIESGTFAGLRNLESIQLPDSLTAIYSEAFQNCESLTDLYLPNSLLYIGPRAFYRCAGLQNILFNEKLRTIESEAFSCCSSLSILKLPNRVQKLGDHAFLSCSALRLVSLPNALKRIPTGAFKFCTQLRQIFIPSCVRSIGDQAFAKCTSLQTLDLHQADSLSSVNASAFIGCKSLNEIYINPNQKTQFCLLFPVSKLSVISEPIPIPAAPSGPSEGNDTTQ